MKKAWDEIGEMIMDGFPGTTMTVENSMSSLIFHYYKVAKGEHWLTIKEDYDCDPINTINVEGEALEALYEFIGKVLNKH